MSAIDRFLAKIEVAESGCWMWTASLNKDGYGVFWDGVWRRPRVPNMVNPHRWAYSYFIGDPGKLYVLHRCDTPPCVNPDHLFLGTQADNVKDCTSKGRRVYTSTFVKLTPEIHEEIRRRYTGAHGEQTALGREYGVSQATIHAIVGGQRRERCS